MRQKMQHNLEAREEANEPKKRFFNTVFNLLFFQEAAMSYSYLRCSRSEQIIRITSLIYFSVY